MESDKAMQKWKVHMSSSLFEQELVFELVNTFVVRSSEHKLRFCVCEYVWLTGGTQWGLWLIMVIHTVGSQSCQYNLNGKETTGLGCPCFAMLETWHLA